MFIKRGVQWVYHVFYGVKIMIFKGYIDNELKQSVTVSNHNVIVVIGETTYYGKISSRIPNQAYGFHSYTPYRTRNNKRLLRRKKVLLNSKAFADINFLIKKYTELTVRGAA